MDLSDAICNTALAASSFSANSIPCDSKRSITSSEIIAVLTNQGAMMFTRIDIIGIVRRSDRMIPRTPHLEAQYCGDPG